LQTDVSRDRLCLLRKKGKKLTKVKAVFHHLVLNGSRKLQPQQAKPRAELI
jgi:hypothetical protein